MYRNTRINTKNVKLNFTYSGGDYMKYKGLIIIIKEVITFDYYVTKHKNTLLIYYNKNLSKHNKSRILHKAIRLA